MKLLTFHDAEEAHEAFKDSAMQRKIADVLCDIWPDRPWGVYVSHAGGVANITLAALIPEGIAYVLHLHNLQTENGMQRWVKEAGGTLLECLRLTRDTACDLDQLEGVTSEAQACEVAIRAHKKMIMGLN